MAKKSAKSKGYRKTAAKKAYLTKKEITITAVVAGIVILALALFIGLYDDGALNVRDGEVQVKGENSLIINTGTGYKPRYYKIGQLAGIDGYTLTSAPMGADANLPEYIYTPDGESPIDSITVSAYSLDAAAYAAGAEETYTSDPTLHSDGLKTAEDDGHAVRYLTFTHHPADPEAIELPEGVSEDDPDAEAIREMLAAEQAPVLVQALHGYVNAGNDRMVYILVRNDAESEEEYVDDAVLEEAMQQVLDVLSYETK